MGGACGAADIVGLNVNPREPPLVTIVTLPQHGAALPATIESVLSQDYPRIEYIVADGGSTDASLEILERYRDRLRGSPAKIRVPPTPLIADSWKPGARSSPG